MSSGLLSLKFTSETSVFLVYPAVTHQQHFHLVTSPGWFFLIQLFVSFAASQTLAFAALN